MPYALQSISCDRRKKRGGKKKSQVGWWGWNALFHFAFQWSHLFVLYLQEWHWLIPVFPVLLHMVRFSSVITWLNSPPFSFRSWEILRTVLNVFAVSLLELLAVVQALPTLILLSLFSTARQEEIFLDSTSVSGSITVEGGYINMSFLLGWLKRCHLPHSLVKRCLHLPWTGDKKMFSPPYFPYACGQVLSVYTYSCAVWGFFAVDSWSRRAGCPTNGSHHCSGKRKKSFQRTLAGKYLGTSWKERCSLNAGTK